MGVRPIHVITATVFHPLLMLQLLWWLLNDSCGKVKGVCGGLPSSGRADHACSHAVTGAEMRLNQALLELPSLVNWGRQASALCQDRIHLP